jgi:hypothetical protein
MSNGQRPVGKEAMIPAHLVPIIFAVPVIISIVAVTNKERSKMVEMVNFLGIDFLSIGIFLKNSIAKTVPIAAIMRLMMRLVSKRDTK